MLFNAACMQVKYLQRYTTVRMYVCTSNTKQACDYYVKGPIAILPYATYLAPNSLPSFIRGFKSFSW